MGQSAEFFFIPVELVMLNDSGGTNSACFVEFLSLPTRYAAVTRSEGTRNSIDKA